MPGASPSKAIDAFLNPLREAMACVGGAHFTLTPGARGAVGEMHQWALNDDIPVHLGDNFYLRASMQFETLDQGQSNRDERFRVSTRGYMYAVENKEGRELIAAHWHPNSSSSHSEPHWHVGSPAISPDGVFLERAHIPSPRISFEHMIRWTIQSFSIEPAHEDWQERLATTEQVFDEHKSWD